jgi:tRNA-Thr(GGU) m(6)t(6)A37 methyltransferase TsaA
VTEKQYFIEAIGVIRSPLTNLADAPRQGDEGGQAVWLELHEQVAAGLVGLEIGDELMVLTWLHLAQRDVLQVQPRGDRERPLAGEFATRTPQRPKPIGLHRVTVLAIGAQALQVAPMEAIDGTPIVDIKPILEANSLER